MPTILQNERAKLQKNYGISKYIAYKIKNSAIFYPKITFCSAIYGAFPKICPDRLLPQKLSNHLSLTYN